MQANSIPTPPANTAELIKAIAGGAKPKFLFFFGHRPQSYGKVDDSCLSQWFPKSFTVDGITYPTSEHWMMAEKARLFKDEATLHQILRSTSPADAKKLGRLVRNFSPAEWGKACVDIVARGNYAKFSQNPELKEFLLSTGDAILVEASPYDKVWGIGMGKFSTGRENPGNWKGANLLGYALMQPRHLLRKELDLNPSA